MFRVALVVRPFDTDLQASWVSSASDVVSGGLIGPMSTFVETGRPKQRQTHILNAPRSNVVRSADCCVTRQRQQIDRHRS